MNKRTRVSPIIISIFIGITFTSCKTKSLSVKILKPAEIYVPSDIKTLAVVNRDLPEKGNDDFKNAEYKVVAKQWEDAANIWKKYVNDPDYKIAGRACYNMALASEVLGKYEIALDWAKKAYADYHLKDARNYINILERRIKDEQRLK